MMASLRFYLKRISWSWVGISLLFLILVMYLPARHNITAWPAQPISESQSVRVYSRELSDIIQNYRSQYGDSSKPSSQQTLVKKYSAVLAALRARRYRSINKLALTILSRESQHVNTSLFYRDQGYPGTSVTARYKYLVVHNLDVTPMVSARSDAVNVVAQSLGANGHDAYGVINWNATLTLLVILGIMCILFGDFSTDDYQRGTYSFVRALPESEFWYHVRRGALLVSIICIGFLTALILVIFAIAVTPDHSIGDFRYPITVLIDGQTVLIPIWQFFSGWLLLVFLWASLLACLSILLGYLTRSRVLCSFLLVIVVFARELSLLRLLPEKVRMFVPSSFTVVPELFYQEGDFVGLKTFHWTFTFIFWIVFILAITCCLIASKSSGRWIKGKQTRMR